MISFILGCTAVDVAIAIDASGSIGRENFYTILNFTKTFVNNLNIDGNKYAQVGVIQLTWHPPSMVG